MIESVYITLIILGFIFLPSGFFLSKNSQEQPKFLQEMILFAISAIIFGALAVASASVEFVTCTSTTCTSTSLFYEENMYMFGFFALISTIFALVKSFDAFYFSKGKI